MLTFQNIQIPSPDPSKNSGFEVSTEALVMGPIPVSEDFNGL